MTLRMAASLVEQLDEEVARMTQDIQGLSVSRNEAVRVLLREALEARSARRPRRAS